MKVSFISPWDIRGGIFQYQKYLIEGFQARSTDDVDVEVTRLARYHDVDGRYLKFLAGKALRNDPDVVHIQHEGQRYGFEEASLYDALGDDVVIVTTVHSAQQLRDDQQRTIIAKSDRVIVHNEHELKALAPCDAAKPVIVPHGCKLRERPSKPASCAALDIDPIPDTVALTYGFLGPWKNVDEVIRAVHKAAGITHVHAGEWYTNMPHGGYAQRVRQMAANVIPSRHQWTGYVPDEDLDHVFGVGDFAVYANEWASESGSMAEMFGAGVPVLAHDILPYNDGRPVEPFEDRDELEETIQRLRDDEDRLEKLSSAGKRWAEGRDWPTVAGMHIDVYNWALNVDNWIDYQPGERMRWETAAIIGVGDDGRYTPISDAPQVKQMTAEYVRHRLGDSVLDVGCGDGRLAVYVDEKEPGYDREWIGTDPVDRHMALAHDTGLYANVIPDAMENLTFNDRRFDTVVFMEALEHTPAPDHALSEAFRILKDGGNVVVTSPHPRKGRTVETDPWAFTCEELRGMAEEAGFFIEEVQLLKGADGKADLKNKVIGTLVKPNVMDSADEVTEAIAEATDSTPEDIREGAEDVDIEPPWEADVEYAATTGEDQ